MPAPVRAVFLGNAPWSVPSLERLARTEAVDVVLVATNPPRPAGRGSKMTSTPVADAAGRLALPTLEVGSTKEETFRERLRSLKPDVSVVVAYGELLSVDVLDTPRLGSVNLHFSLLPRWRGASPVAHALLEGDRTTGVTVIRMDEGLDTGAVLARREEAIRPDDDAGSLGARLASVGAGVVIDVLADLAAGRVTPEPQSGPASYAPKLGPADRTIPWDRPASAVVRQVRAFAPDPAASTTFRGGDIRVLRAEEAGAVDAPAGTVTGVDRDGVLVATGRGAVRLLEVAPAGKRRMPASDWARGVRELPGERLGS